MFDSFNDFKIQFHIFVYLRAQQNEQSLQKVICGNKVVATKN